MKILVTGANGFIGSHIVRALHKARTWELGAMVRPGADLRFLQAYSVRLHEGTLPGPLPAATELAAYDCVVHVAGKVSDWGEYRDFFQANVVGALELFDRTPAAGGFIHLSSNAVLGEESERAAKPESAPYRPVLPYAGESVLPSAMNAYRLTKALGEMLLIKRARERGRRLTVVRPVWVYGPREFHAGPYEYCRTVAAGVPCMPGTDRNRFHVVYAGDLARVVAAIAADMPEGVEVYNVGHPTAPLMTDYWAAFCRALGRPQPRRIPKGLLYPVGCALEALWTLVGATEPPLFTRARVYLFYADNLYDVAKVGRDYPMDSWTPIDVGARRAVRWWRRYGYL